MKTDKSPKSFKSFFVPEEPIDVANYITEIIIKNYLSLLKKPFPACPFWRKETVKNSPQLKELSKRYIAELVGVKELLKDYDADVITEFFVSTKKVCYKLAKKENKEKILAELQIRQEKKKNKIESDSLKVDDSIPVPAPYFPNKKTKLKISGINQ